MPSSTRNPNEDRNQGVGSESEDRGSEDLGSIDSSREGGNRPAGNIEGDETLNRR